MADRKAKEREVELAFLEGVHRRLPEHLLVLESLGHLYTAAGRIEDGLRADLDLTARCPEVPLHWYNLACSHSLLGQLDEGIAALERAVELGYDEADWATQDPDLANLRGDPRFTGVLARMTDPADQSDPTDF
jgi:predicted Zn-dependent protease